MAKAAQAAQPNNQETVFVERVIRLDDYRPHPRNYNKHPAAQIERLRLSLRKFGQPRNIVVWREFFVAGHGVAQAAMAEGWETLRANVIPDDWPEERALAFLAADNELSRLSDPDQAALAQILDETRHFDEELMRAIGYDDQEFEALLAAVGATSVGVAGAGTDTEPQVDKAEELRARWNVELGQLWQLGDHRIICGDCTDPAVVARVMGGERARLCFTSPPYADQREYQIGKFDWLALATGFTDCVFANADNPFDFIVNLGMSYKDGRVNFYWNDWLSHSERLGHPLYGWYVWDKGRGFPGEWNGRLAPSHEFLFHFCIGRESANKWVEKAESSFERIKYKKTTMQRGQDGEWRKPSSLDAMQQPFKVPDSVVRIWPDTEGYGDHPAIFPIEFADFGLKTWSQPNSIVYEPFSGSGTTLIACQNLGRKCRAVEISPAYVAVALQRFADHTGIRPELLNG